jgi:4-amino-4-deoxy-L-arabinose transferase-like glycosyltransferase
MNSPSNPATPATDGPQGLTLLLVLACYLGTITLLRLLLAQGVGLDDAEQLVFSQHPQLGYGIQPPLYSWLLWALTQLFGVRLELVALLREALLGAILIVSWLAAREVFASRRLALLVVLSLLCYPQILIDLHREGTHTLLLSLACALSLYLGLLLLRQASAWRYLALGLVVGMGMLSKYSYVVFAGGLLLAALSLAEGRRVLFDRRILLTLGASLLVLLPHGYWALLLAPQTLGQVGGAVATETGRMAEASWLVSLVSGNLDLLRATLGTIAPLLLIYGLALLIANPPRETVGEADAVGVRLAGRLLLFEWLWFSLGMLLFGATHFHSHWMAPLLLSAPIPLLALLRRRLTATGIRRLLISGLCVALLGPGIWLSTMLTPDRFGHYERAAAPFAELAQSLRQQGFENGLVIAPMPWIAGNLRLHFPQAQVITDTAGLDAPSPISRAYVAEGGKAGDWPASRGALESLSLPHHRSRQRHWGFDYRILNPGN